MSEQITILISSNPPPNPSILRVPSTSRLPVSSSSSTPSSISFAPLPKVEGKRRRNRRPLGVAGRAELLQESKQRLAEMNEDNYYGEYDSYEPEEEIPLPDIGKLVKGLWRTISRIRDRQSGTTPSIPESLDTESEQSTYTDTSTNTGKGRPNNPDISEKPIVPSSPEILPLTPKPSGNADEDFPQIQISSMSTSSSKDLEALPKGLDDRIQVSVFNALKVQNP